MNIEDLEKEQNEGIDNLPLQERRKFLKMGLAVTGVFLGGTVLSLTSISHAGNQSTAEMDIPAEGQYPYPKHYGMIMRQNRCVDCELCVWRPANRPTMCQMIMARGELPSRKNSPLKTVLKNESSGLCFAINAIAPPVSVSARQTQPTRILRLESWSWITKNVSAARHAWPLVPIMPVILMKKNTPSTNVTSVLIPGLPRAKRKPPAPLPVRPESEFLVI